MFLSNSLIAQKTKKRAVITILITVLVVFNTRNLIRINKEIKQYNYSSLPFFYVPKGNFKLVNLNKNINVYIPKGIDACWATKTPCVNGADHLKAKKRFGFNIFLNKYKQ